MRPIDRCGHVRDREGDVPGGLLETHHNHVLARLRRHGPGRPRVGRDEWRFHAEGRRDQGRRRRHDRRAAGRRQERACAADRHRCRGARYMLLLAGDRAGEAARALAARRPPRRPDAGHARPLWPAARIRLASRRPRPRLPTRRRWLRQGLRLQQPVPAPAGLPKQPRAAHSRAPRDGGRPAARSGRSCPPRRRPGSVTPAIRRACRSSATSTVQTSAPLEPTPCACSAPTRTGSTATATATAATRLRVTTAGSARGRTRGGAGGSRAAPRRARRRTAGACRGSAR